MQIGCMKYQALFSEKKKKKKNETEGITHLSFGELMLNSIKVKRVTIKVYQHVMSGDQEVVSSTPTGRQYSFMEIDHEIFSMVILSLPLIQEGQLSVLAKDCAQYWLTA